MLLNMTLEEQHQLFLQELAKKHTKLVEKLLYLELLTKSTGNDFFGFVKDEQKNVRNNAICRAVVECVSNLQLQTSIRDIIAHFPKIESENVKKTGDIAEGFNRVCLGIDKILTDIDVYTLRRDKYLKENVALPKKTYQYSIGDPASDQRKLIGELYSDPKIIKYFLHNFWMGTDLPEPTPEETRTKFIIYELAKVRSQEEIIQKIYEQSVDEISPLVKGFRSDSIFQFINTPQIETLTIEVKDLFKIRSLITKQIMSNVNKHPDLVTIFKAYNQQQG